MTLTGGFGNDTLSGGPGNDTIEGDGLVGVRAAPGEEEAAAKGDALSQGRTLKVAKSAVKKHRKHGDKLGACKKKKKKR